MSLMHKDQRHDDILPVKDDPQFLLPVKDDPQFLLPVKDDPQFLLPVKDDPQFPHYFQDLPKWLYQAMSSTEQISKFENRKPFMCTTRLQDF